MTAHRWWLCAALALLLGGVSRGASADVRAVWAVELGTVVRPDNAQPRIGALVGLVADNDDVRLGWVAELGYELGDARGRWASGPRVELSHVRLDVGYALELHEEALLHGVRGTIAVPVWTDALLAYVRGTALWHEGQRERSFEVGLRLSARRTPDEWDTGRDDDGSIAMAILARTSARSLGGLEARVITAFPFVGFVLGVAYERVEVANVVGQGATLSVGARVSLANLLGALHPVLPQLLEIAPEIGVDVGGVTHHGFRGAIWAGASGELRLDVWRWEVAPILIVGYRAHLLRRPRDAAIHHLSAGVGLRGFF